MLNLEIQKKEKAKKDVKKSFADVKSLGTHINTDLFELLDNAFDYRFVNDYLFQMLWKCRKGLSSNPYELSQVVINFNDFIEKEQNIEFDIYFRLLGYKREDLNFDFSEIYERISLLTIQCKDFVTQTVFTKENDFENEINLISENQKNAEITDKEFLESDFTLRRKTLILLLLTFGRLDAPQDLIKQRIVEFFHGLTGGSIKNIQDLLINPTKHTGTKKSVKRLCDDLHFVRNHLEKLGLSENVQNAINEIGFLIDELNQEN